ncbi:hypothetical protein [Rossellomorea vietnamensis]|uniref:hypothetical protein n=1 Tax=Rossellomorea vietnamensis TaxID=218284 RepID=UPI001E38DCEA|nr:hypothetical protein [Rossellomorea vietnamensis]MCC5801910.1 hypothetical protein [Rossellomorea vietnamensis]
MLDYFGFLLDLNSFMYDRLEFWLDLIIPLVMLKNASEKGGGKEENKKESSRGGK